MGRFLPLAAFALLAALMGGYLIATRDFGYDSRALPSALIGSPAPQTELAGIDGGPGLTPAMFTAPGPKLVNVFASWCVPCRAEHPMLMRLAGDGVTLYGLNQRDKPEAANAFLAEGGNPYTAIGADTDGRASVDWGVYGVPETFVIDGSGRIVAKHTGPITAETLESVIRPALAKAGGAS